METKTKYGVGTISDEQYKKMMANTNRRPYSPPKKSSNGQVTNWVGTMSDEHHKKMMRNTNLKKGGKRVTKSRRRRRVKLRNGRKTRRM